MGRRSSGPHTFSLGDALGIAQHHDAVSGTAKQHTTNDYAKRLTHGVSEVGRLLTIVILPFYLFMQFYYLEPFLSLYLTYTLAGRNGC